MATLEELLAEKARRSQGPTAAPAQATPGGGPSLADLEAEKTRRSQQPSVSEDISAMAPSAAVRGFEAIPASPGEVKGKLVPATIRWLMEKTGASPEDLADFDKRLTEFQDAVPGSLPDMGTIRKYVTDPVRGAFGAEPLQDVQAQTTPGKFAQSAIENAPGALLDPGSRVAKLVQWLGSSGLSEGAGQLAEKYLPEYETAARIFGGGAGSTAPSRWNSAVNPRPIPPRRSPHVEIMDEAGVPLSAGQRTGDPRLMKTEEMVGNIPAHEAQGEAFTSATLDRQGGFPEGSIADRQTMSAEVARMGAEFDRLTARSTTPFDQALQDDLLNSTVDYLQDNPLVAPRVESVMNDLAQNAAANGGVLTGEGYANTRTKINDIIRDTSDDGLRSAMVDFQDALDDAVGRYMSPEDQSAFRTVRAQYRNYMPIEHGMASGGKQASASGVLSPAALDTGIKATRGKRAKVTGDSDFQDLADAGAVTMERKVGSGTPEGLRSILAGIIPTGMGGAAAGLASMLGTGNMAAAGVGGAAMTAASAYPAAKAAFIRSPAGQAFLARQGPRIATDREFLAAMLAAGRAGTLQGARPE